MEILKKLKFSRRHALRGMVSGIGVSMWLPVLEIMCNESGTAFAQGTPLPTTFGIFFWGNGIHPGSLWTPSGTGDGSAWQLPTNLQDFAQLKDYMTLVTGLDMLSAEFKDMGGAWSTFWLAGRHDLQHHRGHRQVAARGETRNGQRYAVDATIDQLTPRPSLQTSHTIHRDGHPEVHGDEHGTASLNLAHSARTSLATGARSARSCSTLVHTRAALDGRWRVGGGGTPSICPTSFAQRTGRGAG